MKNYDLIDKLEQDRDLPDEELLQLLTAEDAALSETLAARARAVRHKTYGEAVYLRGLIEFTNHCRNDCYYCGIRRSNARAERYRLTPEQILSCADQGYAFGFRTFVLQGGEDPYYSDETLCALIRELKRRFPDCAVTLSIGEKERESYEAYFQAGADRYLLRHETADAEHYSGGLIVIHKIVGAATLVGAVLLAVLMTGLSNPEKAGARRWWLSWGGDTWPQFS